MPMHGTRMFLSSFASALALVCLFHGSAISAEAHPDFSGVWTDSPADGFRAFARNRPADLPFTVEGKRKADEFIALFPRNPQLPLFEDGPAQHCLPHGMPDQMLVSGTAFPMEIFQRPGVMLIIYEGLMDFRHLYFGERIVPPDERIPDRNGYSAARWEGETLVVETDSFPEAVEQYFFPHSDQARLVERYRMSVDTQGARELTNDWTLTDPVFYTRPISGTKKWVLDPKGVLLPYRCTESEWLKHVQEKKKAHAVTRQ